MVGDFLERHYVSWVDEPMPALSGRGMLQERTAGRPAIDSAWLWAELGLTRE